MILWDKNLPTAGISYCQHQVGEWFASGNNHPTSTVPVEVTPTETPVPTNTPVSGLGEHDLFLPLIRN